MSETIFALSSGALPSGVAIIRLSGCNAQAVAQKMCGFTPLAAKLRLADLCEPDSGMVLDRALVCGFVGPHSYTGEDVVEFHCHGGRATVASLLKVLARQEGCRLAEPGEFSRRAFENEKMDLTALEGLSDLIAADTEAQRKLALRQSGGDLRELYDGWRSELVRVRALIEAELDFSDEEDIPDSVSDQVWETVEGLVHSIGCHLDDGRAGEIVRDGYRIALLGPPNAGKSSLLNALTHRDVAIVTPIAGTTRDTIDVDLDISGYKVIVTDTAGLRATDDIIEQEGIRRAEKAALAADLVLWLHPPGQTETTGCPEGAVIVFTKSDLPEFETPSDKFREALIINTIDAKGLDPLLALVADQVSNVSPQVSNSLVTRQRHRSSLTECVNCLSESLDKRSRLDVGSELLRQASDSLGRITGRVDVEDLLDVIFC